MSGSSTRGGNCTGEVAECSTKTPKPPHPAETKLPGQLLCQEFGGSDQVLQEEGEGL